MMFDEFYEFIRARMGFDTSHRLANLELPLETGRQLPSVAFSVSTDGTLDQVSTVYEARDVRHAAHWDELEGEFAQDSLAAAQLRGADNVFGFKSAQDEKADYVSIFPASLNWRKEIARQKTIESLDGAAALLGNWRTPIGTLLGRIPEDCILAQVDVPLRSQQQAQVHIRPICVIARGLDAPLDGAPTLLARIGLSAQAAAAKEWIVQHPQSDAAHSWEITLRMTPDGEIQDEMLLDVIAPRDTHKSRSFARSDIASPKCARFQELIEDSLTPQQLEKARAIGDGFKMPYLDSELQLKNLRIYAKVTSFDISLGPDGAGQVTTNILFSPYLIEGDTGYLSNIAAVQWHITDACDQRCKHCYIFAEDSGICLTSTPYDKLIETLDELDALFTRKFGAFLRPVITGGDPILHPRFWDFLRAMHDRGLSFNILGNPFHLTPDVCDRLRELGCKDYQLSMDGLEEFHDSLRKPGSYQSTLQAITSLQESGVTPVIMLTVSNANIDEVESVVDQCVRLRVGRFAFARYCPTSAENAQELHIEPERYRRFLHRMLDVYNEHRSHDCFTRLNEKEHLFTLVHWERGEFQIPKSAVSGTLYDGCHCAQGFCILPNRDLMACRRMESVLGNLNDAGVQEICDGPIARSWRDASELEKCTKCELFGWCRGCQAVGAGYTGNRLSPDPQCWKTVD